RCSLEHSHSTTSLRRLVDRYFYIKFLVYVHLKPTTLEFEEVSKIEKLVKISLFFFKRFYCSKK
ncbi:MAG: hypothetical protein RMH75_06670, partial [Archaeoglobaceae archaeon]|nr:hypothetical protein [Archaeoglobaceae archaeon]